MYGLSISTDLCSPYSSMYFLMLIVSMLWCCPTVTFLVFLDDVVQVWFPTWFPSPDYHARKQLAYDSYLFLTFSNKLFLTSALSSDYSFVLFAVHDTRNILLNPNIYKHLRCLDLQEYYECRGLQRGQTIGTRLYQNPQFWYTHTMTLKHCGLVLILSSEGQMSIHIWLECVQVPVYS